MEIKDYRDIFEKYGPNIIERYKLLFYEYNLFIKSIAIQPESVQLVDDLVFDVLLNYFTDVDRIKKFAGIDHINNQTCPK